MALEPIVASVLDFQAFKAYEDCSAITASTASDVMCLDGSETEYGANGTTIKGGLDDWRGSFFWLNFVTALGTFGVETVMTNYMHRRREEIRDLDNREKRGKRNGGAGGDDLSVESEVVA